jgi:hypothetical protein
VSQELNTDMKLASSFTRRIFCDSFSSARFNLSASCLALVALSITTPVMTAETTADEISHLGGFDFRLTLGVAPGISTLETSESRFADGTENLANNGTDEYTALAGFTLEPGVFYSFAQDKNWGFVLGGSVFYRTVAGEATYAGNTNIDLRLNTYGVDFAFGPYFQHKKWRFEFMPVLGIGQGKTSISVDSAFGSQKDNTERVLYVDYGYRMGVLYALPNYVAFGLHVGYQAFFTNEAGLTQSSGASEKDKVSGDGLIATLSFILVF